MTQQGDAGFSFEEILESGEEATAAAATNPSEADLFGDEDNDGALGEEEEVELVDDVTSDANAVFSLA